MWNANVLSGIPLYCQLFGWLKEKINIFSNWPQPSDYNYWSLNCPVIFVAQKYKRTEVFSMQYEPRIYLSREVLTRDKSWHDFFNALVWMSLPNIKLSINHHHYRSQLKRQAVGKRSRLENNLTHFDECGAIILSSNMELLHLIANHRWHELFWLNRGLLLDLQVIIIGHATYEALLTPYVGLTTKSILFKTSFSKINLAEIDEVMANKLGDILDIEGCLAPFPILGLPGVIPQSYSENFYRNANYFRQKPVSKVYKIFNWNS